MDGYPRKHPSAARILIRWLMFTLLSLVCLFAVLAGMAVAADPYHEDVGAGILRTRGEAGAPWQTAAVLMSRTAH